MKRTKRVFRITGLVELEEVETEPVDVPSQSSTNAVVVGSPQPPLRTTGAPITMWYKSKSDSKIDQVDGKLHWEPVKKPTTVHGYFNYVDFEPGARVICEFDWRSDGYDGSNKEIDGSRKDWTHQGKGISDEYLRCLAGTGDFRMGLFESDDLVLDDSVEGPAVDAPATEFNDYMGFQLRWHPHLSKGFANLPGRLMEDKDKSETESHNNLTLWTRISPGRYGLMSDEAQKFEHSGFSKSDGWGTQPVSWGAEAPFGDWVHVQITAERINAEAFTVKMRVGEKQSPKLVGNFKGGFAPRKLDCFAITYTNSSRRYKYVDIQNFEIKSEKK